jgi:hypothetical protein
MGAETAAPVNSRHVAAARRLRTTFYVSGTLASGNDRKFALLRISFQYQALMPPETPIAHRARRGVTLRA